MARDYWAIPKLCQRAVRSPEIAKNVTGCLARRRELPLASAPSSRLFSEKTETSH